MLAIAFGHSTSANPFSSTTANYMLWLLLNQFLVYTYTFTRMYPSVVCSQICLLIISCISPDQWLAGCLLHPFLHLCNASCSEYFFVWLGLFAWVTLVANKVDLFLPCWMMHMHQLHYWCSLAVLMDAHFFTVFAPILTWFKCIHVSLIYGLTVSSTEGLTTTCASAFGLS